MSPHPQDGDFDFRIASLQSFALAIFRASSAHIWNLSVTFSHDSVMILSHSISDLSLGVHIHHKSSGQTGIASQFLTRSIILCMDFELQSYLQLIQARQALTRIIIY
jgi:hypothetical protein